MKGKSRGATAGSFFCLKFAISNLFCVSASVAQDSCSSCLPTVQHLSAKTNWRMLYTSDSGLIKIYKFFLWSPSGMRGPNLWQHCSVLMLSILFLMTCLKVAILAVKKWGLVLTAITMQLWHHGVPPLLLVIPAGTPWNTGVAPRSTSFWRK